MNENKHRYVRTRMCPRTPAVTFTPYGHIYRGQCSGQWRGSCPSPVPRPPPYAVSTSAAYSRPFTARPWARDRRRQWSVNASSPLRCGVGGGPRLGQSVAPGEPETHTRGALTVGRRESRRQEYVWTSLATSFGLTYGCYATVNKHDSDTGRWPINRRLTTCHR